MKPDSLIDAQAVRSALQARIAENKQAVEKAEEELLRLAKWVSEGLHFRDMLAKTPRTPASKHVESMAAMRRSGATLEEIGLQFGPVSKERVRQLLEPLGRLKPSPEPARIVSPRKKNPLSDIAALVLKKYGPLHIQALREHMIKEGWVPTSVKRLDMKNIWTSLAKNATHKFVNLGRNVWSLKT